MRRPLATIFCCAALLSGCGDDDSAGSKKRLVVSAATSLTTALESCSRQFEGADVKLSFASSDKLAAQIRQGVQPDVFAAANTKLPDDLAQEGLLDRPREFVTNTLVVAVPKDSPLQSLEDLAREGVKVSVGSESTPIGTYTREVLGRLAGGAGEKILANVRSNDPDVNAIIGKVAQGAVDAGFVYISDVNAAKEQVRDLPIPGEAQPTVVYAAGVVKDAPERALARRYVDGLVSGPCYDELQAQGFGPVK